MNEYERLILRLLGAILYCVMYPDAVSLRQGHNARKELLQTVRTRTTKEKD